jgi:hypothetical protein
LDKEPIALARAKEMAQHLAGQDFQNASVLLTLDEGFELMDHLVEVNDTLDQDLLEQDARAAHAYNDPWHVLRHFTLMGFSIERLPGSRH